MKQEGISRPVLFAIHICGKSKRGGSEHSGEVQILLWLRAGRRRRKYRRFHGEGPWDCAVVDVVAAGGGKGASRHGMPRQLMSCNCWSTCIIVARCSGGKNDSRPLIGV